MKRSFFLLAALWVALCAMAQAVSEQQAEARALQFLSNNSAKARGAKTTLTPVPMQEAFAPDCFYAFNVGEDEGFVLVSADERTASILGYSDKGSFDPNDLPDNMRGWLEGYTEEILWAKHHLQPLTPAEATAKARSARRAAKRPIEPMIQTKWTQSDPYNRATPQKSDGSHYVTGCVAVALGQLLYFHAVTRGTGKPVKTLAAGDNYEPLAGGVKGIAFNANTPFVWADMLPSYTGKEPTDNTRVVANLMRICGYAVQSTYKSSSTSGKSSIVPYALRKYFGYPASVNYKSRKAFSMSVWEDMVYNELAHQRPVFYRGETTSGSHAFLIDGYDGEGFFSVNWGWKGRRDGFFLLSVLNPEDTSGIGASHTRDGYAIDQAAVFGADPNGSDTKETLIIRALTVPDDKDVYVEFINGTGMTETFDYGLAFYDGSMISSIRTGKYELKHNHYVKNTITLTGKEKGPGTYKIVPISRVHGETKWQLAGDPDHVYITAVYDGLGGLQMTAHPATPKLSAVLSDVSGSLVVKGNPTLNFDVRNASTDEFYDVLYLFASTDASNMGTPVTKTAPTVPALGSATVQFFFEPKEAGTYHLWVATDDEGVNVISPLDPLPSITISEHEPEPPSAIIPTVAQPAASGAVYNLNGQRVSRPAKGIYIQNGRQVIISKSTYE